MQCTKYEFRLIIKNDIKVVRSRVIYIYNKGKGEARYVTILCIVLCIGRIPW